MLTDQKILLAGFSPDECQLLESTLTRAGFSVCHIDWKSSVPQATIACVILNLSDGAFDSGSNLLRHPSLIQSGCLSVLPPSNDHARLLAMTMGTDDIVYRPIHYKELIAKVSILIDKYLDRQIGANTLLDDDIDLIQRLQDLSTTHYSGTMKLSGREGRTAQLSFDKGAIIDAVVGQRRGQKAIASLWRVLPARLELVSATLAQRSIHPPLEVSRAVATIAATIQTFQHISKPAPSLTSVCSVDWNLYRMSAAKLPRQVRDLMPIFDGSSSLDKLLDSVSLDEQLLVKIFAKLVRENMLMFPHPQTDDIQLDQWVNSGPQSYASLPPVPVASAVMPPPVVPSTTRQAEKTARKKDEEKTASPKGLDTALEPTSPKPSSPADPISLADLLAQPFDPSPEILFSAEDLEATRIDMAPTPSVEEKLQEDLKSLCKSGELFKITSPDAHSTTKDSSGLQNHLHQLGDVQETDVSIPSVVIYPNDSVPSTPPVASSEADRQQPAVPPKLHGVSKQPAVSSKLPGVSRQPAVPPKLPGVSKQPTVPPKLPGVSRQPAVPSTTVEAPVQPVISPSAPDATKTAASQPSAQDARKTAVSQPSAPEVPKRQKHPDIIKTSDPQYFPSFLTSEDEEDEKPETIEEPIRHSDDGYQIFHTITEEDEADETENDEIEGQFFGSAADLSSGRSTQSPPTLRSIPTPEQWQNFQLNKTRILSRQRHKRQQLFLGIGIVVCLVCIVILFISLSGEKPQNDGANTDTASAIVRVDDDAPIEIAKTEDAILPADTPNAAAVAESDASDSDTANAPTPSDTPTKAQADALPAENPSPDSQPVMPFEQAPQAEDEDDPAPPQAAAPAPAASAKPQNIPDETKNDVQSAKPIIIPTAQADIALPDDNATGSAESKPSTKTKSAAKSESSKASAEGKAQVVKPKATVIMPDTETSKKQDKTSKSAAKSANAAGSSTNVPVAALLGQAQQALRAGKLDEARNVLAPALKSSSNDARVNMLAARIEAKAGMYDKAIDYLKKTEAQNKAKPSYWKELGSYQQSSGQTAEARASYQKAYDLLDPESTEATQLLNRINKL